MLDLSLDMPEAEISGSHTWGRLNIGGGGGGILTLILINEPAIMLLNVQ